MDVHQLIPPGGGWALLQSAVAAAITGILSWFGGKGRGQRIGEEKFLNAVQEAAALVISKLEREIERVQGLHGECEHKLAYLQKQIDDIMGATIAAYQKDRADEEGR